MSSEEKMWFSATELSLFGEYSVADLPKTMQGVKWRAKKGKWLARKVKGSGGPGGILTEYQPPADVLALIQSFLDENPGFFENSKARKPAFHIPVRSEAEKEAERLRVKALFDSDRIDNEIKTSFGDAPAQYAKNPNAAFEVLLKRLSEATQATVRISKQYDHPLPTEWTSLIQELMSMHGLSEVGAKRVVDELLKTQARK